MRPILIIATLAVSLAACATSPEPRPTSRPGVVIAPDWLRAATLKGLDAAAADHRRARLTRELVGAVVRGTSGVPDDGVRPGSLRLVSLDDGILLAAWLDVHRALRLRVFDGEGGAQGEVVVDTLRRWRSFDLARTRDGDAVLLAVGEQGDVVFRRLSTDEARRVGPRLLTRGALPVGDGAVARVDLAVSDVTDDVAGELVALLIGQVEPDEVGFEIVSLTADGELVDVRVESALTDSLAGFAAPGICGGVGLTGGPWQGLYELRVLPSTNHEGGTSLHGERVVRSGYVCDGATHVGWALDDGRLALGSIELSGDGLSLRHIALPTALHDADLQAPLGAPGRLVASWVAAAPDGQASVWQAPVELPVDSLRGVRVADVGGPGELRCAAVVDDVRCVHAAPWRSPVLVQARDEAPQGVATHTAAELWSAAALDEREAYVRCGGPDWAPVSRAIEALCADAPAVGSSGAVELLCGRETGCIGDGVVPVSALASGFTTQVGWASDDGDGDERPWQVRLTPGAAGLTATLEPVPPLACDEAWRRDRELAAALARECRAFSDSPPAHDPERPTDRMFCEDVVRLLEREPPRYFEVEADEPVQEVCYDWPRPVAHRLESLKIGRWYDVGSTDMTLVYSVDARGRLDRVRAAALRETVRE